MLKLYINTTNKIHDLIESRDEEGFAAAESIALAVLGVVIVAGVYIAFQGAVDGMVNRFVTRVSTWG